MSHPHNHTGEWQGFCGVSSFGTGIFGFTSRIPLLRNRGPEAQKRIGSVGPTYWVSQCRVVQWKPTEGAGEGREATVASREQQLHGAALLWGRHIGPPSALCNNEQQLFGVIAWKSSAGRLYRKQSWQWGSVDTTCNNEKAHFVAISDTHRSPVPGKGSATKVSRFFLPWNQVLSYLYDAVRLSVCQGTTLTEPVRLSVLLTDV
jgi:hypothetical protein